MCRLHAVLLLGALLSSVSATMSPTQPAKRRGIEKDQPQAMPTWLGQSLRENEIENEPWKRQGSQLSEVAFTVTIAPDATCGYVSASPSSAITCDNGKVCLWESGLLNGVICGDGSDALAYLHCLDGDEAGSSAAALGNNLLCTESSARYCHTYRYPDDVINYKCNARSDSRFHSVDFTYSGQTDREFSKSTVTAAPATASNGDAEFLLFSIPVSVASEYITVLPTDGGSDDGDDDSSDNGSGNNSSDSSGGGSSNSGDGSGKNNTGAIAGGVVGGLAVVSLLILGIFLLRRRSTKAKDSPSNQPDPPLSTLEVDHSPPAAPILTGRQEMQGTTVGPTPQADGWVNSAAPYEVYTPAPVYEMGGDTPHGPKDVRNVDEKMASSTVGDEHE
ncbi:hypothetical protein G7046_g2465 [Stylonectria norvegica]|nr:hypothetical protein G7046_g2465 [Stylonectria norvegica]